MSDKLASLIKRRYQKAKELASDFHDRLEINRNLYKNQIYADDNYEWEYQLSDPHIWPLIRNYLSRANPAKTHVKLEARKSEDAVKRGVNQDLLNWELNEILMTSLFYRVLFSGFMAGKGYMKTGWLYEPAVKIIVKDKKGNVQIEKVMRDIVNRANAKFVRYNDLLIPNRNEPQLYEQPYVIELIQRQLGELLDENKRLEEEGKKPYWNQKWLKELKKSGPSTELLDFQVDIVKDSDFEFEQAYRSAYVSMICMTTKDGEEYYLPLKDDDKIVNNDTESRYWHGHYPYIDYTPFPEDDEYYASSIVDVVGDLQIAATEVLNQTLTNIRQINNDMWIAGTPAAQTPDWQFQKRPNGVIRVVGDVSQIQQIRTQDNTRPALQASMDLQNKIERASGVSALYASGAPSQNINQTARGAQIIEQNISANMKMLIDLFGEQVIKRLGEHFLELNSQYITEEQTFFITGKRGARKYVSVNPEEVTANFDVIVNSESMIKVSPTAKQASLQNLITQLANIENMSQGSVQVDLTKPIEALVDAYPEMDAIGDDILETVDEKAKHDIEYLERGQMPEIKARDPHKELIVLINMHFEDNEQAYDENVKTAFEQYVLKHMRYIQGEQEVQAMSQPQVAQGASPEAMMEAMGAGGISQPPQVPISNPEQMGREDATYNLGLLVPPRG